MHFIVRIFGRSLEQGIYFWMEMYPRKEIQFQLAECVNVVLGGKFKAFGNGDSPADSAEDFLI